MAVDLVKTKNPIRRFLTGTWYKVVNEQGERIFCIPYTSILGGKMSVGEWLYMICDDDIESNIQLAFDRWNFGTGNKFDYEILRVLQIIEQGLEPRDDDPFLREKMYDMPWTTPLGISKNIVFCVGYGLAIGIAWAIDIIIYWLPDGIDDIVDEFLKKIFQKMFGKF